MTGQPYIASSSFAVGDSSEKSADTRRRWATDHSVNGSKKFTDNIEDLMELARVLLATCNSPHITVSAQS